MCGLARQHRQREVTGNPAQRTSVEIAQAARPKFFQSHANESQEAQA